MSDFEHLFSSQSSYHDQSQILPDHLASSPPAGPTSSKLRKPPTVTPKRFTKFFTPRHAVQNNGRSKPSGKSGRQLRDITRNALNRKGETACAQSRPTKTLTFEDIENVTPRRESKRRKLSPVPESSPIQSSPLRGHDMERHAIPMYKNTLAQSGLFDDDDESVSDLCDGIQALLSPIRRVRQAGTSRRLLQRSFGGSRVLGRGRLLDHCAGKHSELPRRSYTNTRYRLAKLDCRFLQPAQRLP